MKEYLIEKYIDPQVLPNEPILAWLKWDRQLEYDSILLRYEADVEIERLLNIDVEAFKEERSEGIFRIKRSRIQLEGFLGFQAYYYETPSEERTISFVVDFILKGDKVWSQSFATHIIRPIIKIVKVKPDEIIVSPERPSSDLYLEAGFQNLGRGDAIELEPVVEVKTDKKMKMTMETTYDQTKTDSILTPKKRIMYSNIHLKGTGYGILRLIYKYKDRMKNKYETPFFDVILNIQERGTVSIPLTSNSLDEPRLVLAQARTE